MKTDTEKAHAISRQRLWYLPVLALVLLTHQGLFLSWNWQAIGAEETATWTLLALTVLLVLTTGGHMFVSSKVRQLINDEVTRANRMKALAYGFVGAILTAIIVFAISPIEPLTAQRAAHLIVSVGLASALIVFALEERKALG